MTYLYLVIYYLFAQYLPDSYLPIIGRLSNSIRIWCVKHIFKKCGNISVVNRKAYFGDGHDIEIGDYSGIGANCTIPNNIKIGKYVMMAPDVIIFSNNHIFDDVKIPMCFQGKTDGIKNVIIEDDCWIGQRVIINSGKRIGKGSILAASSVVTKDVVPYSIMGGNPAKLIKSRK